MSIEKLLEIFGNERNVVSLELLELYQKIKEKKIIVNRKIIENPKYLEEDIDNLRMRKNESKRHHIMKAIAKRWLINNGSKNVYFESQKFSGRVDVIDEKLKIIVECGNTRTSKILEAVKMGYKIYVFPYFADYLGEQAIIYEFKKVK